MTSTAQLSVVIPTFQRTVSLLETLGHLNACEPKPAEVIIHDDAGDCHTANLLAGDFPDVRCLNAGTRLGPGGARNQLIRKAKHEIVVSLDDDSYPIDKDFFARVQAGFKDHPKAGVLAMTIIHDGEPMIPFKPVAEGVADFVGCGCAYRRAAFLETAGYLSLRLAYGMEESDLSLQLIDKGWQIVFRGDLRVRHATDRKHQAATATVAAHIRNTALLAFLRYPARLAGLGLAQVANRAFYSIRRGHFLGVVWGILGVPGTLLRHKSARSPVAAETVRTARRLRREPMVFQFLETL